ncbi:MAG: T9SS type A sorting domain-containing protein [Candidatus Cloacimonetes bacterium]|nr:T9SS type A sorting domain-containing protein [Candidatus Cloacimonadota bacterium]
MRRFYLISICLIFSLLLAEWSSDPSQNNGIAMLPGEDVLPKTAICSDGTAYIAFFSSQNQSYNVRLQRLDESGNFLWEENGILISSHPSMTWLTEWDMKADSQNNALLVFQDIRNNGYNDVFIYKISSEGELIWGENGIQLSDTSEGDLSPILTVTNSDNYIVAWQSDSGMIIQKITSEGDLLFGENGIQFIDDTISYSWPQLLSVGDDDFILKYYQDTGPIWAPTRHVYAQRYSASGETVWNQPAVISSAGGISAWTQILPFVSDGNDGFLIAWHDDRDNDMLASVFLQKVDSEGNICFSQNGVELSTQPGRNNFYPQLCYDVENEIVYVAWNEMDGDQNFRGIYAQKIDNAGNLHWENAGLPIVELSSEDIYPLACKLVNDHFVIFYTRFIFGTTLDSAIFATRLDPEGNFVWNSDHVLISSIQSIKGHPVCSDFYNQQVIVSWEDDRNGNNDIYAQNISGDGLLGPVILNETLEFYPAVIEILNLDTAINGVPFSISNTGSIDTIIEALDFGLYSEYNFYHNLETPFNPYPLSSGDSLNFSVFLNLPVLRNREVAYDSLFVTTPNNVYSIPIRYEDTLYDSVNIADSYENSMNEILSIHPNPLVLGHNNRNANSFFRLAIKQNDEASFEIFNIRGQKVHEWTNLMSGVHELTWSCKNSDNKSVSSGIYLCRLKGKDTVSVRKFMVIK